MGKRKISQMICLKWEIVTLQKLYLGNGFLLGTTINQFEQAKQHQQCAKDKIS